MLTYYITFYLLINLRINDEHFGFILQYLQLYIVIAKDVKRYNVN